MTAALLGLICVAASAVILVTLHLLPTGLDPIRHAVMPKGAGRESIALEAVVERDGLGGPRTAPWWRPGRYRTMIVPVMFGWMTHP